MEGIRFIVLLLFLFSRGECNVTYPIGDVRNCPTTQPTNSNAPYYRMEVLPGLGFDNLRNLDMNLVMDYNYSLCKVTNDGRFLIPDDVVVIPLQRSRINTYATFFDHWDNYTSMDSSSINAHFSLFSFINGKYSSEYQHVKQHQYNYQAKTTRVQIRYNLYKIILQPDSPLHHKFKNRLLDIAANLQSNNTLYATYLSDMIVRDYGTHVVRSVQAGAIAAQIDAISSDYVNDNEFDTTSIRASASANFFHKFSFGVSTTFSNSQTDDTKYVKNQKHSQVMTIGGPPFRSNMTLEEWEENIFDNLVAIDRTGDPLHYILTPASLPELPSPLYRQVVDYIYSSIQRYYRINTHYGCTDPSSSNFDYEANINDGSCSAPTTNYTFGGVYQTCQPDPEPNFHYEDLCAKGTAQKNPLTGDYSCPQGYNAIELHNGTVTHVSKKEECKRVCNHFLIIKYNCHQNCVWKDVLSAADYQAFWCVAEGKVKANSGYLFGGVYTSKTINPVTQSMSCPNHFYPVHIGEDMEVCVSTEYDLAYEYSVPFAGFHSCIVGNPLAAGPKTNGDTTIFPKRCPKTYKHILATVDEGCEINYCIKLRSQFSTLNPKLPPYHSKPGLKKNISQCLVIQGLYGDIWLKNEDGDWVEYKSKKMTGEQLLSNLSSSGESDITPTKEENSVSVGTASGISVVLTLFVCTLIIIAVFGLYQLRKRWKSKQCQRGLRAQGLTNSYRQCEDNAESDERKSLSVPITTYMAVNGDDENEHGGGDV